MATRRTLLLSGVAEGLGADIAETFAQADHDVIGISRTDRSTEHLTQRVEQAAFASAKFALRGLAQSLAREYSPKGLHVAHVVLDGLIDGPQTDHRFGASPSVRMDPGAIARAYLDLSAQHPSAWTHEMDLRPFSERF